MDNKSLINGLRILLLYGSSGPFLTSSQISKRLGYSQSKTYRLINTLIEYGLLRENPGTAQYSLGLNAIQIGLLAIQNLDFPMVAKPFMKELALLSKETVLLTAVDGTKGMCLERVESEEPIRLSLKPGATLPLHCGASSKILMAFLPEKDWDGIIKKEGLRRYTHNTIMNVNRLKAHLRQIRSRGYAFSDQEVDLGARAVAAPILNGFGELVAGLSIAGPAYRINKHRISYLAKLVTKYARKISLNLGHLPKVDEAKDHCR